jgi:hypothetical protein
MREGGRMSKRGEECHCEVVIVVVLVVKALLMA